MNPEVMETWMMLLITGVCLMVAVLVMAAIVMTRAMMNDVLDKRKKRNTWKNRMD